MSAKPLGLLIALLLVACDGDAGNIVHRTDVNGVATLHSRIDLGDGQARAHCVASSTSRCHYTVFDAATAAPIAHFVIAVGEHRTQPWQPGMHVCVAADGAPRDHHCKTAPAVTS
ncbi:MAG: hypothetical protein ACRC2H_01325 [Silanimonas sp.]